MQNQFKRRMKAKVIRYIFLVIAVFFVGAAPKPYTIMVYMNGSDLESDFGLATADLAEMLDSGLNAENANVIIFTGGASRWQNSAIPEYECIVWQLYNGWLNELENFGNLDMGDPSTLQNFITFCMDNFPADKYGLIMWDHGGGSIAGFGHDENFNNSSLTLLDMITAFENAGLRDKKLEFLGFDACLMASVEMAVLASDYANVLIASEDLEPGDGWDYHFLSALNQNPKISGIDLGKVIVDTFMDFYGPNSDEILTLSVVDLKHVRPIMYAMGRLMVAAKAEIAKIGGFNRLAERRTITKTFGEGSPRDNYADMVDIGDMAWQLCDLFPYETDAVFQALENSVVYNRHNSDVELYGLSTFYIYGGKSIGEESLDIYSSLEMDENYTEYLHKFFAGLSKNGNISALRTTLWDNDRMVGCLQSSELGDFIWPKLNGHFIPLYPMATTINSRYYVVPAEINDEKTDIVILFSSFECEGRVVGSRSRVSNVFPKGFDPILADDKVAIYYQSSDGDFYKGDTFIAGQMELTWEVAPHEYLQKLHKFL